MPSVNVTVGPWRVTALQGPSRGGAQNSREPETPSPTEGGPEPRGAPQAVDVGESAGGGGRSGEVAGGEGGDSVPG